jgi:hypothetical protein
MILARVLPIWHQVLVSCIWKQKTKCKLFIDEFLFIFLYEETNSFLEKIKNRLKILSRKPCFHFQNLFPTTIDFLYADCIQASWPIYILEQTGMVIVKIKTMQNTTNGKLQGLVKLGD